jgi:hypothetical protein
MRLAAVHKSRSGANRLAGGSTHGYPRVMLRWIRAVPMDDLYCRSPSLLNVYRNYPLQPIVSIAAFIQMIN